ncbi:MAG: VTT domain-containing protein [archaeon]|nr:VTT domain-containing protein [archaeon]
MSGHSELSSSESSGLISLALGFIREEEPREHFHDLSEQQANERAFEAASRALEDSDPSCDSGDQEGEDGESPPRGPVRRLGHAVEGILSESGGGEEEEGSSHAEDHRLVAGEWGGDGDEEELDLETPWDDAPLAGSEGWRGWLRGARSWAAQRYYTFTDCPWRRKSYVQLAVVVTMVAVVVAAAVYFADGHRRDAFKAWIRALGSVGYLVFIGTFVFTNLPFGFGFIGMVTLCGYLYELVVSISVVLVGVSLGALVCYYVVSFLLRESMERTIAGNRKLQVLVFAARANGLKLSCLIRFIPIPVGVQTGVLAIASIPVYVAVPCSVIAFIPELILVIYFAHQLSLTDSSEEDEFDLPHIITYVVAAVLLVVALVFLFWMGRKALRQAEDQMQAQEGVLEAELQEIPHSSHIAQPPSETHYISEI